MLKLKLYVTGQSPNSKQTINNLKTLCETSFPGDYEMTVIDLLEHPRLIAEEKILVTPTLIKEEPHPVRRLVGDFSDTENVLSELRMDQ